MQQVPRYNYNDYKNWKEDWELINGYPYSLQPSPKIKHQSLAGKVYSALNNDLLHNNNCNCVVLYETDWIVNDETVVRPDVMIICDEGEQDYPTKAPRLIVEILSDSTQRKDRNEKFELYQANGVPYYLIADPSVFIIEYFQLIDNKYKNITTPTQFQLTATCTIDNTLHSFLKPNI